jgi:hypothetical protein
MGNNFFIKVSVTSATFPSDAQAIIDIRYGTQAFSLVNEGSAVIEYSFDGINVHGDMTPSSPTASLFFDNRSVMRIWFRTAGTSLVRVEAWARIV